MMSTLSISSLGCSLGCVLCEARTFQSPRSVRRCPHELTELSDEVSGKIHSYLLILIIMASLLALSILWMNFYQSYSLAWSPVPPPVAVRMVARASSKYILFNSRRLQTHHHHYLPSTSCTHHYVPTLSLALSNLETDVTQLLESEDELQQLTVPELKEKLRSNGQKVCLLVCLY